jgi:hypothetical protein
VHKLAFLINPASGGGAGAEVFARLEEILGSFGVKRETWTAEMTEPGLLEGVGADLVAEPDPAALLAQVDQHAPAVRREVAECALELLAAVAAQAAEQIPGQAGRVQTHGYDGTLVTATDDDGDVLGECVLVAKHRDLGR